MGKKRGLTQARVVLDTDTLVSALLFSRGRLCSLCIAWQAKRFALVSRATANERIRVLNYPKFRLDRSDQDALLADFLPYAETVELHVDLMFLLSAKQAGARMLVSGDSEIQAVRGLPEPTRIVTAAELLQWLDGAWTFP